MKSMLSLAKEVANYLDNNRFDSDRSDSSGKQG